MGALTGLKCLNIIVPDTAPAMVPRYSGNKMAIGVFEAVLPASYDTGGSVLDVSGYYDVVDSILFEAQEGMSLSYVRATLGAPATGKVKAYAANASHTHTSGAITIDSHLHTGPSHTHDIAITGGAAPVGTGAVGTAAASGATTFEKEEAGNATVATAASGTGNTGGTVATASAAATGATQTSKGAEVAGAVDLSAVTIRFTIYGRPKIG